MKTETIRGTSQGAEIGTQEQARGTSLRALHVYQSPDGHPNICHDGGARIASINSARTDSPDYSRLIVASANSYMKHAKDPIAAAEGDLLALCLQFIRETMADDEVFLHPRHVRLGNEILAGTNKP